MLLLKKVCIGVLIGILCIVIILGISISYIYFSKHVVNASAASGYITKTDHSINIEGSLRNSAEFYNSYKTEEI